MDPKKPARPRKPSAGTSAKTGPKADGAAAVLEAIAAIPGPYRAIGERIHAVVMDAAPELTPRLWYGMPAYAKGGKVICFFRGADKFKERYLTIGFNDAARLDDGRMWPVAFALTELTREEEERIAAQVRKAVGSTGR